MHPAKVAKFHCAMEICSTGGSDGDFMAATDGAMTG
jgi:hypothetical protein